MDEFTNINDEMSFSKKDFKTNESKRTGDKQNMKSLKS
jgi:hypothetical protein